MAEEIERETLMRPKHAVIPCNDTGSPSKLQPILWIPACAGMTISVLDLDT
jgi:hypothetical protein